MINKEILGEIGIEDYHIHPRPDYADLDTLNKYISVLNKFGISRIGFVEHGIRKNTKHKSILFNKSTISNFADVIHGVVPCENMKIYAGIEVDYIGHTSEYLQYLNMINDSELDYIIGSVHGHYDNYMDYLNDTIDMLKHYPIDVLGHFKINEQYIKCCEMDQIFELLAEKKVIYEENLAPRYMSSDICKKYIENMITKYGIRKSIGSDAHCLGDLQLIYSDILCTRQK